VICVIDPRTLSWAMPAHLAIQITRLSSDATDLYAGAFNILQVGYIFNVGVN